MIINIVVMQEDVIEGRQSHAHEIGEQEKPGMKGTMPGGERGK